ncbi:phytanoyl-CoA dioxygenase family protein [Phenylobacterium montanum]|uniref:Phytanoyl-CoA dioxygenase family protein n=1 Tax=Phenylobacterium montanum TaxID=2823693 RepID=A0A975ITB8_9CAUL|nr:phytanoyl-CoA dioxygenase family protein [Caulobacter sp. S6]QUD86309.1 phytanoyl-CoA dioxygenase family protein [Caulobacter sp. S6]
MPDAFRRILMSPIWAGQVFTGATSFVDNPILGSARLNRAGLHVARIRLTQAMASLRRAQLAHLVSAEDRAAYHRDGFVLKRDFLPPALYRALMDQLRARRGPARETTQGNAMTRRIALDPEALAAIPAAREVLKHPAWRGLIRYVGAAGQEPVNYVQTILTQIDQHAPDPQLALHADAFYPTVKAWLFLTDVAEDAAPLTYVPGSHRMTPARLAWEQGIAEGAAASDCRLTARGSFRITEAELAGLGLPPPRRFVVPGNTLVVADTSGFHARGSSAGPTTRVEIWAYGRRNPFLPWSGLDLLGLTGLAPRQATTLWWALDRLQEAGLKHNVWHAQADRSAFDPSFR